ncbi:hypothetical protein V4F39_04810 [Aquincola sp. MAHUQ-54]|uniref:Uncharacterized protein n=1 Tax=Aquincola agrisoli TaxID=3119538 RepID=A0AAW9Q1I8_9BURK
MKRWRCSSLAATLALSASVAGAHGDWPAKHGGEMNVGGEITMEMVRGPAATIIYVEDHGEPVMVAGTRATLELQRPGGSRSTLVLRHRADNSFQAEPVDFEQGSRILVTIEFDSGILMVGRFLRRFF